MAQTPNTTTMQPICMRALRAVEGMLLSGARHDPDDIISGLTQITPLRTCNQHNTGLPCAAMCARAVQVVSEIACEACADNNTCDHTRFADNTLCFST